MTGRTRRTPGERPSLTADIAQSIRGRIADGLLAPGTRLVQNDIAQQMGVSPTPVREAFQLLAAQGFVNIDTNKGAHVTRRTEAQVKELYEIRIALESLAAVTASRSLTEADYASLAGIQASLRSAATPQKRLKLNGMFHMRIYDRADMPELSRMIRELRERVAPYLMATYRKPEDITRQLAEHEAILAACRSGNRSQIEAAICVHLEQTEAMAIASVPHNPDKP